LLCFPSRADIEDRDRKLNELCGTVRELQEEIALKEKALVEERMSSEKEKALDEEVIAVGVKCLFFLHSCYIVQAVPSVVFV